MKLVVITPEQFFDREPEAICLLFENGLERLHLRKPYASFAETKRFIERIDAAFHPKIVLHDYYELTNLFRVGGIHLNNRNNPGNRALYSDKGSTLIRSCHSFEELVNCPANTDYVFLSPVFDSISKAGYKQEFTPNQLRDARDRGFINERVIALGGITAERISAVRAYGFGGVAVLGALWAEWAVDGNIGGLSDRFGELRAKCK
jgi:thiamine-phosphate pyrophosphorylase